MSGFIDNKLTVAGKALMAEVNLGAMLQPTRIVMGSGYMTGSMTLETVTNVIAPVVELDITKKKKTEDGDVSSVTIGGVYTNQEIEEEFYFRELGLYCKATREDGTEVSECLFSYGNAGDTAELMIAYSSGATVERQIDLVFSISNDANVDLSIASGTFVTMEDLESAIAENMPELDFVPNADRGVANGVATLDETGKVPAGQLPDDPPSFDDLAEKYGCVETYPDGDTGTITCTVSATSPVTATRQTVISTSGDNTVYTETTTVGEKETERVTTETATTTQGELAAMLNPETIRWRFRENEKDAKTVGNELKQWWEYLKWQYGVQTVIADGDGSTYAKIFTETIENGDSTIGTCVTKKSLDGSTFTAVYTIGTTVRTLTTTINGDGTFTEVWS